MIWLNGEICDGDKAISAQDRGLLLGESVFETILLKDHVPQFWHEHLIRLRAGCAALDLTLPYDDARLADAARQLLNTHENTARAVLRLTITGGSGGRGLLGNPADANIIGQISPAAAAPASLKLADCDIIRMAGQVGTRHKTGTYIDNILARKQALADGGDEAVMRNQYGRVACAAAGNIFAVFGSKLVTPPESEGALPGIIRQNLLAADRPAGLQPVEGLIEAERLRDADAIFVTNSVNQVVACAYDAVSGEQKKQGLALNEALPEFTEFKS